MPQSEDKSVTFDRCVRVCPSSFVEIFFISMLVVFINEGGFGSHTYRVGRLLSPSCPRLCPNKGVPKAS